MSCMVAEMASGGWVQAMNWDSGVLEYLTADHGRTWQRTVIEKAQGTHQATRCDIDGDGNLEIVGKEWGMQRRCPKITIWKKLDKKPAVLDYRHHFIDRDKPARTIEILAADVDGDGNEDILTGNFWYRSPDWKRYEIPGVSQIINAYDIDGDGRKEIFATEGDGLTSRVCWLRPVDPLKGKWEKHPVGTGHGDWPHGSLVAPVLPGGKIALIAAYHGQTAGNGMFPEIFEAPDDLEKGQWKKRALEGVWHNENMEVADFNGNGLPDIAAGKYWLENMGDGDFKPHKITEEIEVCRVAVMDVNGNGRPDVILTDHSMGFDDPETEFAQIAWFENPGDPGVTTWKKHLIDMARCPHSLCVADIDGDGEMEIVCGEHDTRIAYRSRCRMMVYKQADRCGRAWKRYLLDSRFEHHDGAKIIELAPGRLGIMSIGWMDSLYVHLWAPI